MDDTEVFVIKRRYKIDKGLSKGPTAQIYLAYDMIEKKRVVVKALDKNALSNTDFIAAAKLSVHSTAQVEHSNAIEYSDICEDHGGIFLVREFFDGFDLGSVIRQKQKLDEKLALYIAYQAALALEYLHGRGVAHGNLKPSNILVDSTAKVAIIDIGYPIIGEGFIKSPFAGGSASLKNSIEADRKALGLMLYLMITGNMLDVTDRTKAMNEVAELGREMGSLLTKTALSGSNVKYENTGELVRDIRIELQKRGGEALPIVKEDIPVKETGGQSAKKGTGMKAVTGSVIAAAVILLAIAGFAIVNTMFADVVFAPDLVGMQLESAKAIADAKGLDVSVKGESFRRGVSKGSVAFQEPTSGSQVRKGSTIDVIISKGALTVPNVSGLELDTARKTIEEQGLAVGDLRYDDDSGYKPGVVIDSDPPYGREMDEGSRVDLIISR